jgi:hypothetical protein
LDSDVAIERMMDLFCYFGGTIADVVFECSVVFNTDIQALIEQEDWTIVFLSMIGRLDAAWVERQDQERKARLVRMVRKMVELRYKPAGAPADDNTKEWM